MTRLRSFDAVLFDFSGVLVDSAFDAMRGLGGDGVDGERMLELLLGPYDRDTDHPWHRVERGELPIADWLAEVQKNAAAEGIEVDFGRLSTWFAELVPRPEMLELVRRLRTTGYRTALVTNNVREAGDSWRALMPLDELFDVVVDSCEVGMRKPDPRIYELTLDRLGVEPARAVFLDDHPGNVAGAQRAGLAAVLVRDPQTAIADLDALLAASSSVVSPSPSPPATDS
jgi:epoxide hydrolase-like predicted phosphatase